MDPLTMMVSALTAGAIAALEGTASQAVKDAYAGLVALIKRKFADKPRETMVLDEHSQNPQNWEKPLQQALGENHIEQDQAILQAAQALTEALKSQGGIGAKYSVQISDAQGVVVGDQSQVEMNFGEKPVRKRK